MAFAGVASLGDENNNNDNNNFTHSIFPHPVCGHCGASSSKSGAGALLFCSQCHAVRYCDADCQRRDWRFGGHKESCNKVVAGNVYATRSSAKKEQRGRRGVVEGDASDVQVARGASPLFGDEDSDSRSSFSSSLSSSSLETTTTSVDSSCSLSSSLSSSSSSSSSTSALSSSPSKPTTFSLEELRFALHHMPDHSKSGPDGFPVLFYKTFFDHLGPPLLKVLEETLIKIGREGEEEAGAGNVGAIKARKDDWIRSGWATRELISIPKDKRKSVSLRGTIQKALKFHHNDEESDASASSSSSSPPPAPPQLISHGVHSRPAIGRQLRAMSAHPEVDYVIFSSSSSTTSKKNSSMDSGVVILNADARLLFRVNWNHAVFATPREAVAPHARLLFEQLRGPPPRFDRALDRLLAAQLKREFGCEIIADEQLGIVGDVNGMDVDDASTSLSLRSSAK